MVLSIKSKGKIMKKSIVSFSSAIIVISSGADIVFFKSDLPNGIWPYTGSQQFKIELSKGSAEEYLKKNFKGIDLKIVDVNKE